MWRAFKHVTNILFYPYFNGWKFHQLLPGGKWRTSAGQLLDSSFPYFAREVLLLEKCNKTGIISESDAQVILKAFKYFARSRFTDESVVNMGIYLLFPVRSFRMWRIKRRMLAAMRTGAIYKWTTELQAKSVQFPGPQPQSGGVKSRL